MTREKNAAADGRTRSADRMSAAEWVAAEQARAGLTRRAMGEALGVHAQAVYQLRTGRWVPSRERLAELRAAFEAWLLLNDPPGPGAAGGLSSSPAAAGPRLPEAGR